MWYVTTCTLNVNCFCYSYAFPAKNFCQMHLSTRIHWQTFFVQYTYPQRGRSTTAQGKKHQTIEENKQSVAKHQDC